MNAAAEQEETPPETDGWRNGIDKADAQWDVHDCEIKSIVQEYDMHLSRTAGYVPLDWRLVKAMLWVETGAKRAQWKTRPMQIGNTGDPGLLALLGGDDGGELIVPPTYRGSLSVSAVRSASVQNIRAGTGYLLMRMAVFSFKSIADADTRVHDVTVGSGDNMSRIAKARGSTPEVMKELNPDVGMLRPGQVLHYRKASVQRVITGWRPITASSVATYYNAGGDSVYADKLNYALTAVRKRTEATCK